MLELLKQQEKQQDLKQQEIQQKEDLKILHENIEQERFAKLLVCLTKQNDPGNLNIFSQESVINSVGEFIYKPEEVTFEAYLRKYESIFEKRLWKMAGRKKVSLLLGKFQAAEYEKYVNFRQPGEVTLRETIQILNENI